jgi:ABC-type transport system involved in multi-copper enzyme maturation permease subunit
MRAILRVAKATYYEGWRRRFLNGILIFAILIIGSSWVFTYLQPGAELKMLIDVGLGSIRFFGMLIAIFLGTRLIPDEIEKRTIYTLLAKPVTRTQFLLGKYLGGLATVISNVLLMGLTFYIVFLIKAPQFARPTEEGGSAYSMEFMYENIAKAILLNFFELAVVMSIAVVASVVFSWVVAAIFSFFVYFVGQMSEFFGHLADPDTGAGPVARVLLLTVYRILPHFETFDVREAILTDVPVLWTYVGMTVGMGLIYTAIVLALGYLFFNQREV